MAYPQFYPQYNPQTYPQQQSQSAFLTCRGEMEARNYPISYGTSITFKDETAPYIYTKTMGFSQLDTPRFEKFRIVKEEALEAQVDNLPTKSDNEAIWAEIEALKKAVFKKKAKEVANDDTE